MGDDNLEMRTLDALYGIKHTLQRPTASEIAEATMQLESILATLGREWRMRLRLQADMFSPISRVVVSEQLQQGGYTSKALASALYGEPVRATNLFSDFLPGTWKKRDLVLEMLLNTAWIHEDRPGSPGRNIPAFMVGTTTNRNRMEAVHLTWIDPRTAFLLP